MLPKHRGTIGGNEVLLFVQKVGLDDAGHVLHPRLTRHPLAELKEERVLRQLPPDHDGDASELVHGERRRREAHPPANGVVADLLGIEAAFGNAQVERHAEGRKRDAVDVDVEALPDAGEAAGHRLPEDVLGNRPLQPQVRELEEGAVWILARHLGLDHDGEILLDEFVLGEPLGGTILR